MNGGGRRAIDTTSQPSSSSCRQISSPMPALPPVTTASALALRHVHAATSASTRSGLPLPFWIFSGGQISTAPVGGSRSRLAQALQAVAAGAVHVVVARVGRAQVVALAGVGADRLGAEAEHVALLDQEAHRLGIGPGVCWPVSSKFW